MAKTRSILFIAVLALAAALTGALVARQLARPTVTMTAGTWFPEARPVRDFSLIDQDGAAFDLSKLQGSPSLLFFGFTHCPDVCPTTLALLAQLDRNPPVPDLRTVLVTVDPQRDDAASLKRYVGAFSPRMIGLTGDDAQLDLLMTQLGAARVRQPGVGDDYLVDHSATVYLLDRNARLVAVFTPPLTLPALRADLAAAASALEH
ncbi:MAG: SCO family protein [Steroidobacteraceae bacterium]